MGRWVVAAWGLLLALPVCAAVGDYTRTAVENYNGHAGATLVSWVKSTAPLGRAWALKFDMTKGFRLRCHYASTQMPVGTMGAAIAAEGETPVAGINGDYFYNKNPTGAVIEDSQLVFRGQDGNASMWMQFFGETADHELFLGKLTRLDGLTTGNPANGYDFAYKGRKVRNAQRVNWANYPVHNGKINPVNADWPAGSTDHSLVKPNTIGNYQPRDTYPRTMIGYGTNELGHALLVLFVSDGRQPSWSAGVSDVDAAQMMIDEGCLEVGECDGGGSATLWAGSSGYLNRPSDGSPRSLSSGFFVLAPKQRTVAAQIGEYGYESLDEAVIAARPEETVERVRKTVGWFKAEAADDSTQACAWSQRPEVVSGTFRAEVEAPAVLTADGASKFIARVETVATVVGGSTAEELEESMREVPRSVLAVREEAVTLALSWCGLVYSDGVPTWVDLTGCPCVSGETYMLIQEFKRIKGVPHVRYRVARRSQPLTLTSAEGVEWFTVPGSDRRLSGVVDVIAPAGVKSVEGRTDASPQDVGLGVIIH